MHMETAPFVLDLPLDRKAVTEEDGDIYIEGYASDFETDRQNEAFEVGAFEKSLRQFLDTNPTLLYHHDPSRALGVVEDLEMKAEGLWMRARIDQPAEGSWASDVVQKVRKGTIKGLSVGGLFKRRKGPDGTPRIYDADLAEISVTPLPVNPRTLFAVATKAFESPAATVDGEQLVLDWFANKFAETSAAFGALEVASRKP